MKAKSSLSCLLAGATLLIGATVFAGDPQPTPKPEVQKKAKPKTLADLAAGIKLGGSEKNTENTKKKGVVIDNTNLKQMGEGAVISQGGSLAPSSASTAKDGKDTTPDDELEPQRGRSKNTDVERLEAQLEAVKKAEKENKKANMYNGSGPQYRSPGARDPLELQREELEAQLKAAKRSSGETSAKSREGSRRHPKTR